MRKENKHKVLEAVRNLAYIHVERPNDETREMTIALSVPDIANPWFPSLIKGVENVARIHDYGLLLADSENSVELERRNLEMMVNRGIEGIILIPTHRRSDSAARLVDADFPLVFLDRCIENRPINFVTSANRDGAYQATRYLVNLGHRRIVYIAGNDKIDTEWQRRAGFLAAIEEAGISKEETAMVPGNYSIDEARRSVETLLAERTPFTAVFASDDVMAYGARVAIEAHGFRIPQDISLIGFDDIAFSAMIGLTTVAQSPFELGRNAVTLLNDIIAERVTGPQKIELPTRLVIRDSSAPLFPSAAQ